MIIRLVVNWAILSPITNHIDKDSKCDQITPAAQKRIAT